MKTFLFISFTDYKHGKLTGAHKRFIELVKYTARSNRVILFSRKIPNLHNNNLDIIGLKEKGYSILPAHIYKIIVISHALIRKKKKIKYDYAVSFGLTDTICYKVSGYKNIVTLFREDFVGYRRVTGASKLKLCYFEWLEKKAVESSEKIIVQCKDDKDALIERHGKNIESKIYIQTNNINASWIVGNKARKSKKDDRAVRAAFIGNFADERKGQSILLPAVKKLIDDGYNIELSVAGDGKLLNMYKKEYESYNSIIFKGRVKDVSKLLADSDIEVVPSLMDSCPNAVLEGINAGVAVYGTNVGGIRDILRDEGYLFEPTSESIYTFIKDKIDGQKFVDDVIKQKEIKKRLTFDWGSKILAIITSKTSKSDKSTIGAQ